MYLKKFCIVGCTTRNVFKKSFILRVVQPAIWKVQNMKLRGVQSTMYLFFNCIAVCVTRKVKKKS